EHVVVVQDFLRRVLGGAYPLYSASDPTHPHVDFDGAENALAFIGPGPRAAEPAGWFRYALGTDRREHLTNFVMKAVPELGHPAAASVLTDNLLLPGIEQVAFSYFGETPTARSPQWQSAWTGRGLLPQLVRIQVRLRPGDPRLWPDLLVAPRILADIGC